METYLTAEFITTFAILLGACGLFAFISIRERRPRQHLQPSLVPAMPVLMVATIVAVLALVHIINILGIKTGQ